MESGESDKPARIYEIDLELLHWKVRKESAARNKRLKIAEIIHELCEPLRAEKRAEQERAGNT